MGESVRGHERCVTRTRMKSRTLPFGAPPRAWALSEWSLLPLRAFIGVTFLYAGIIKLSNPAFFEESSHISIQKALALANATSPIRFLVSPLAHVPTLVGLVFAIGEVAVGVGTLLGLWGRVAAVGGAILSFSLFLTVSFHSAPYFTGADIVFFFAWIPLILAGSGTRLSVDALIARRAHAESRLHDPELVAVPFSQIQSLCGNFDDGRCTARNGQPCAPAPCPVLAGTRAPLHERGALDLVDRRTVVIGASRAALVAGATVVTVGIVAGASRALATAKAGPSATVLPTTTTTMGTRSGPTTTTQPPPAGTDIGSASDLRPQTSATFTCPNGDPGLVICPAAGTFVAYDAVCPHLGCTVGYFASADLIVCPCHGSEFAVATGDVVQGPALSGLNPFTVTVSDGNLFIS
jgi:thiosulfate dehydrogenase (quinone) large subunit